MINKKTIKWLLALIAVAALAGALIGLSGTFFSATTIVDLVRENKQLQKALTNLTAQNQIGYAKVLEQTEQDGKTFTKLLFVVTDRNDLTRRVLEREYMIEGDVVHFDALIVKFNADAVADGRERALYLWRRVYGENMSPSEGFPIEQAGVPPKRYEDISARLSLPERELFWSEIWALSNDPDRLKEAGIAAIYGHVVYKKLQPGLIYVFKISNSGELYPETVPDL